MRQTTPSRENLFRFVLLLIVGLLIMSGIGMVGVTFAGLSASDEAWPRYVPVIDAFKQTFQSGFVALLSLLGGRALSR